MDVGSIAAAFVAQQAAQLQIAVAAKMLRMNAQAGSDAAKLLRRRAAELRPRGQPCSRRGRQTQTACDRRGGAIA
jgi:hypothetical protein